MTTGPSTSTTAWSTRFQVLLGAVRDVALLVYGLRWGDQLMAAPGPVDLSKVALVMTMLALPPAFWADRIRQHLHQPAPSQPSVNGTGVSGDYQPTS